jgi:Rad3-related DNA helicase
MISVKHKDSNITVTPMPSIDGLFSDATNPDCSALSCCLIRAASTSALRSLVSIPQLTKEELESAIEDQVSNYDNWSDSLKSIEVSDEEVQKLIDSDRGFTEEDIEKEVEDKTLFKETKDGELVLDDNGIAIVAKTITKEEAESNLLNKNSFDDLMGVASNKVSLTKEQATAILVDTEKEKRAKSLVDQLISSGHLVTDLDAVDDEGNEIYADWKDQFEVIEME